MENKKISSERALIEQYKKHIEETMNAIGKNGKSKNQELHEAELENLRNNTELTKVITDHIDEHGGIDDHLLNKAHKHHTEHLEKECKKEKVPKTP